MASLAVSIGSIASYPVQASAGVRLEVVHDFLRTNLGLHNCVHMIRPNMHRQQTPTTVQTDLPQGLEDGILLLASSKYGSCFIL